jgi:hypothetical protein
MTARSHTRSRRKAARREAIGKIKAKQPSAKRSRMQAKAHNQEKDSE